MTDELKIRTENMLGQAMAVNELLFAIIEHSPDGLKILDDALRAAQVARDRSVDSQLSDHVLQGLDSWISVLKARRDAIAARKG